MEQGIILAGVGGVYEVQTQSGVVACTLRGRLRLLDDRVLVGDRVEISRVNDEGIVETILPRQNELDRPPIANLEQLIAVFAVENPKPSLVLLDRILVQAELAGLECVVLFNKTDLDSGQSEQLQAMYQSVSYRVLLASAKSGNGLEELTEVLAGKISTFAGPSGVGKSSLLNALDPDLNLATQAVSTRVQRGRHTTRTVRLLPLANGYVADTPGFSQLGLKPKEEQDLQFAFPEISKLAPDCRFRGCLHRQEPGCAVKAALEAKEILTHRYEHYLLFLSEIVPDY